MLLYSDASDGELQVLLGKRAHNPGRGTWSIPGGGVKHAESFRQAACREVSEEIGIPVNRFDGSGGEKPTSVRILIPPVFHWRTFLVPMPANVQKLTRSYEFHECRWFRVDALPEPLHWGVKRAVKRLKLVV